MPGPAGSHNWHPMSFSPDTGLVYIPARQAPLVYMADEDFEALFEGFGYASMARLIGRRHGWQKTEQADQWQPDQCTDQPRL